MAKKSSSKKRMTREEAEKLYKDEWVVFCDAKLDLERGDFVDGVVYWHGPDQQESLLKAAEVKGDGARFYTGSITYKKVTLNEDNAHRKRVA